MDKKLLGLVFAVMALTALTGCTTAPFNQKYAKADWQKVIIAPIDGQFSEAAELELEHALSTSSTLNVVPASMVEQALEEHKLLKLHEKNPNLAMYKLAELVKAEGIVFAQVKASQKSLSYNMVSNQASIYVRLVDAKTKNIVASSQEQASSVLNEQTELVQSVSREAADDLEEFFAVIKDQDGVFNWLF